MGQHQSVQMAGINPAHPSAPTMRGMESLRRAHVGGVLDDVFSETSLGQHQSVQMAGINPAHPAAPTMHGMGRTQVSGVDAQNFYSPTAVPTAVPTLEPRRWAGLITSRRPFGMLG